SASISAELPVMGVSPSLFSLGGGATRAVPPLRCFLVALQRCERRLANGRNISAILGRIDEVATKPRPAKVKSGLVLGLYPTLSPRENHVTRQSQPRQKCARRLQRGHRNPDERRPREVRGGQGIGR